MPDLVGFILLHSGSCGGRFFLFVCFTPGSRFNPKVYSLDSALDMPHWWLGKAAANT